MQSVSHPFLISVAIEKWKTRGAVFYEYLDDCITYSITCPGISLGEDLGVLEVQGLVFLKYKV